MSIPRTTVFLTMPRRLTSIALALLLTPFVVRAQERADSVQAAARTLFSSLAGQWSCQGGFPSGRSLSADLRFEPLLGGRALGFEHVDRAPGLYWQRSTWAADSKTRGIVSSALTGSQKDPIVVPALFVSTSWTTNRIELDADTVKKPPFTPNRFTYTVDSGRTLKMTWELSRNGAWVLGDSLVCARKVGS